MSISQITIGDLSIPYEHNNFELYEMNRFQNTIDTDKWMKSSDGHTFTLVLQRAQFHFDCGDVLPEIYTMRIELKKNQTKNTVELVLPYTFMKESTRIQKTMTTATQDICTFVSQELLTTHAPLSSIVATSLDMYLVETYHFSPELRSSLLFNEYKLQPHEITFVDEKTRLLIREPFLYAMNEKITNISKPTKTILPLRRGTLYSTSSIDQLSVEVGPIVLSPPRSSSMPIFHHSSNLSPPPLVKQPSFQSKSISKSNSEPHFTRHLIKPQRIWLCKHLNRKVKKTNTHIKYITSPHKHLKMGEIKAMSAQLLSNLASFTPYTHCTCEHGDITHTTQDMKLMYQQILTQLTRFDNAPPYSKISLTSRFIEILYSLRHIISQKFIFNILELII
jgi:hypothetical protein